MNIVRNTSKKCMFIVTLVYTFLLSTYFTHAQSLLGDKFAEAFNDFMAEYQFHIAGGIGFGVMTGILAFITLFMRLGAHADNPTKRKEITNELLVVGICTGFLGAIPLVYMLYVYIVAGA
ncbi:hypothetical protein [Bacillus thuringiensis]|uniref:hypothetical protein n=1 Tax=Bacillus thuringiensis TaxID=1428 RepID=UPI00119CA847|nr:hypothetical protein [Bacillus thuringiensis]